MKAFITFLFAGLFSLPAFAATSLEDQLHDMDAGNSPPEAVSRENFYAVQARYLPLAWKSEVTVGGAINLTGDSFLSTKQLEVGYRLHFSDKWSLGAEYDSVSNSFTSAGNNLLTENGAVPDVPYAKSRTEVTAEYHVFYGKFRWSTETVSYFDQYVAVGPGIVQMNNGTTGAGVADAGFVFWIGRFGSMRIGVKDYVYNELYRSGPQLTNNLHVHLDAGVVF